MSTCSASADGAIDRPDWYDVGGGESGYIAPDPTDPEIVYAGSYGGEITRYDHRTGETQSVNPWPVNPIGWAAADEVYDFRRCTCLRIDRKQRVARRAIHGAILVEREIHEELRSSC